LRIKQDCRSAITRLSTSSSVPLSPPSNKLAPDHNNPNYLYFQISSNDVLMSQIVMTALGGMFVAKKTGQGAKSGAFCGLLIGLIATLLMILSMAAPDLFPALRMYVDPYASPAAHAASSDRSIWLLVALVALPVSLVGGPVLGAFGARMWRQKHPISGPVDR
jgi:hypothetical protein